MPLPFPLNREPRIEPYIEAEHDFFVKTSIFDKVQNLR
jgi:hypothetical protein